MLISTKGKDPSRKERSVQFPMILSSRLQGCLKEKEKAKERALAHVLPLLLDETPLEEVRLLEDPARGVLTTSVGLSLVLISLMVIVPSATGVSLSIMIDKSEGRLI